MALYHVYGLLPVHHLYTGTLSQPFPGMVSSPLTYQLINVAGGHSLEFIPAEVHQLLIPVYFSETYRYILSLLIDFVGVNLQ